VRPLSYDHATAVGLLRPQLDAFVAAAESFSDYDLLGASRVHGWSRLEAVVHVRAGLEEMVGVCATQVEAEPDHDAASYWASFAADDNDAVPQILWMRRTAAAYSRPEGGFSTSGTWPRRLGPRWTGCPTTRCCSRARR
jgi:hypothetical protein